MVRVGNQGTGPAPGSVTTVEFGTAPGQTEVVRQPTSSIPPGGFDDVEIRIPSRANLEQEFTITVDAENQVEESNKENNIVFGSCTVIH